MEPMELQHVVGSSPRVRGKQFKRRHQRRTRRIIPARAGQTLRNHGIPDQRTDHPRACGANDRNHSTTRSASGSSPRVRGKQMAALREELIRRIIPARAGQTTG